MEDFWAFQKHKGFYSENNPAHFAFWNILKHSKTLSRKHCFRTPRDKGARIRPPRALSPHHRSFVGSFVRSFLGHLLVVGRTGGKQDRPALTFPARRLRQSPRAQLQHAACINEYGIYRVRCVRFVGRKADNASPAKGGVSGMDIGSEGTAVLFIKVLSWSKQTRRKKRRAYIIRA